MIASGQKPVKPVWKRFAPTNAVNQSQFTEWNRGLASTPNARLSMIIRPAKINTLRSILMEVFL